jgi:hypothetical protein
MKSTSDGAGQGSNRVDAWRPCSQERAQGEDTGANKDLTITPEDNSDTLLTGSVVDQAALHGLLKSPRPGNAFAFSQQCSSRLGQDKGDRRKLVQFQFSF